MPQYKLGLSGMTFPDDELTEWHADDVAAMQAAADVTSELMRSREGDEPEMLVLMFRVR